MEWVSPYAPNGPQTRFHASRALEKLFLGGVGAGKSLAGVHESIFCLQDNPSSDHAIVSPTYPMLRDVIIPLWQEWVPSHLYSWRKSDQCFTWHPTGRQVFLRSGDRPTRISGLNLGSAWLDEGSVLRSADLWRILQARVRDPKARRRCLFTTTTPDGWNWVAQEFRKPGSRIIVKGRTADNRHLSPDFEAALRLAYGPELAAQYLDAEVLMLRGLAWPVFASIHCAFDEQRALASIVRWVGCTDWGYSSPAAHIILGFDEDRRLYVWDEWYHRGKTREQIARAGKQLQARYHCSAWYADHDPEGVRHMRQPETFRGEELPGISVTLAEKDVVQGVAHFRSRLSVRADGRPAAYVHPRCTNWLTEVDGYQYPTTGNVEVPVGKFGDHALDATRYGDYTDSMTHGPLVVVKATERHRAGGAVDRGWNRAQY